MWQKIFFNLVLTQTLIYLIIDYSLNSKKKIMNPLDSIIQMFLMADTESVIKQVADRQLKGCNLPNEVETAIGIILLAVDDAKTSDHPSSANALYVQSFNRAKYFLV